MIHFMQHINNNKLLSPSLSILKPEITAIFSIFNRIFGIILIIILSILPTIIIIKNNIHYLSLTLFVFFLFLTFIFSYHLIFGKLKLILYFNKIYTLINNNIKLINNIYIIYFIYLIFLVLLNLCIYIAIYYNSTYILSSNYLISLFIIILIKKIIFSILKKNNILSIKNYLIITLNCFWYHIYNILKEDYIKEIKPIIAIWKERIAYWKNFKIILKYKYKRWVNF